jgi:hypothetical protein
MLCVVHLFLNFRHWPGTNLSLVRNWLLFTFSKVFAHSHFPIPYKINAVYLRSFYTRMRIGIQRCRRVRLFLLYWFTHFSLFPSSSRDTRTYRSNRMRILELGIGHSLFYFIASFRYRYSATFRNFVIRYSLLLLNQCIVIRYSLLLLNQCIVIRYSLVEKYSYCWK